MKVGDLVRIKVWELKKSGNAVLGTERINPFGFIVKESHLKVGLSSFRVMLTETGERYWYTAKYLEVISE